MFFFLSCQLVLVSMALGVNVDREPMLELIANAISIIFNNPTDIFWTGRVMDILFDGMDLDCSSEDFNSKAVCTVFEGGEEKQITPHAEKAKFFKFSFFGSVSATIIFCLNSLNKRQTFSYGIE